MNHKQYLFLPLEMQKKKKKTKTDQSTSRIFTLSERKRPTNL